MSEWFIPGEAAVFATDREREWKPLVASIVRLPDSPPPAHLDLHFRVASFLRGGNRFDLDNMVTPVLDAVMPARSTARAALAGWSATREEHAEPGLRLRAFAAAPEHLDTSPAGTLVLDMRLGGPFPKDSRESGASIARALHTALGTWQPLDAHRFALQLDFGDADANITRVSDAPIKPVVDCLFPLFGGRPGAPDDWKVHAMRVRRGVPGLEGACNVRAWETSGAAPAGGTARPVRFVASMPAKPLTPATPNAARSRSMTNYDRLDQAAEALGGAPNGLRLAEILARAQRMFPEMAGVKPESAGATMDYQTINVRGRASRPGDFASSDRWNRSPAFLKLGPGVWRRLTAPERAAFAQLWQQGHPLLRQERFTAAEWDAVVSARQH